MLMKTYKSFGLYSQEKSILGDVLQNSEFVMKPEMSICDTEQALFSNIFDLPSCTLDEELKRRK